MKVSAIIAFVFSLPPLIVYGMSLVSKSHFESVFLTDDQLLKKRFLSIGELAFYLTYLLIFLYILWKLFISENINMTSTILMSVGIFFIAWLLSMLYRRMITNILIKNKTMLKVSIENLGEVYIIKMFDSTTCICSKDPHVDLNKSNDPIYFVRIEDLIKLPITKEVVVLPPRSIYHKLFN
ncbi:MULTISPECIES: hypothetical protein [Exiguobacterium]|uniref:hypothetical protein n=1 Tax=Exiguobacterium TaxID=33986 RepID=UPI001BE916A5|nr:MULTISPECIES: hypothetical protein [Exiguobacterium]MCT4791052.1 hypothetical protein [Exiguobacterium artemiae]